MLTQNIEDIKDAKSIIIDSGVKIGKMTLLFYLIESLFKAKAIVFTPQEDYLFNKRLKGLGKQFEQYSDIDKFITPYYLKEDWNYLKQRYGYKFLLEEIARIMSTSDEKLVVIHKIGEFFEFQNRYEIEGFYKSLIKLTAMHDKKLICLVNNQNENYEFINNIAEDFSDIAISITSNENNERHLSIRDLFHNQEYPPMSFKIHENNFMLEHLNSSKKIHAKKIKNILIAELEPTQENTKIICEYLFKQPEQFNVKIANTLQSILQEIFVVPEIIIVLMKRTQDNFKTIESIKKQLPNSTIIGIIDQSFIRAEDKREAYGHGCDELFGRDIILDDFIVSLEKASKSVFYRERLEKLSQYKNMLESLEDIQMLADICMENSIYFTAFVLKSNDEIDKVELLGRKHDYIYQKDNILYYVAINTNPKHTEKIIESLKRQNLDLEIVCACESTNPILVKGCLI
ncbi:hypothetical protein KKG72_11275 [bacterium]|nr:hypothetical protein [bacterium]MBU1994665.1 hypothetical protein [bacterium]